MDSHFRGNDDNATYVENDNATFVEKTLQRKQATGSPNLMLPKLIVQIIPSRVVVFDQLDLPRTVPFFQLLLSANRTVHRRKHLVIHKHVHAVFGGKPRYGMLLVFPYSFSQITRHTYIECPISLTCQYVDHGNLH